MSNLLLASQSPRRRELLALLELPFEVTSPNVVEVPQAGEPPAEMVVRLSLDKARAACSERNTSRENTGDPEFLVACDTVVALNGEVLGKPGDAAEATAMLRRLRERPHAVYSGVALVEPATGRSLTAVARTEVTMRGYTGDEIAAYVAGGDPLDKAGAYAIQHAGFHPVAELRGCYANVMGLPLCHLTRCLRAWGITPLPDIANACQTHTGYNCAVYESILNDS